MDAASTVNWATPASTVLYAGQQVHWTTQSDTHFTAGHTVASVSAGATGFFTHSGGIQAFAGNGALSLQAHTDQLEILADKAITVLSVNDAIEIKAKEKIVIQAGQSAITLEGGNITFACPVNFTVKGGKHAFDGGGNKAAEIRKLPDTRVKQYDEAFMIRDPNGAPMSSLPYTIDGPDGKHFATTCTEGMTDRISTAESDKLKFALKWFAVEAKKK
jgi:type VI secretion system secreted protein VgrG